MLPSAISPHYAASCHKLIIYCLVPKAHIILSRAIRPSFNILTCLSALRTLKRGTNVAEMTLVLVPEELLKLAQFQFHKRWNNETLRDKLDTLSVSQLQDNIHDLQAELNKDTLVSNETFYGRITSAQNPSPHYHRHMKQSGHLCYKILK